jgi:6-phosphofructokinase 1
MCDFVRASKVDLQEAYQCGVEAVRLAAGEESGVMVSIKRISNNPYEVGYGKVPLREVAVSAKPMPAEYFNAEGNHVSSLFFDYMKPLAGDLPEFTRLEKNFAK